MNLPNKLTVLRIILVPFFIMAYMTNQFLASLILFVGASITDLLDGQIARSRNLITNFGKIMDPLADKVLVYSAFCLFVADGTMPAWMLIIILAREFIVSGIRTVAASEGIVIAADMSGKIKTVLQMVAVPLLIIWHALNPESASTTSTICKIFGFAGRLVLWAALIMTIYSGFEYIVKNKKVFKQ